MANKNSNITLAQLNVYLNKIKTYINEKDGDLFALETASKSNLVAAINEVKTALEADKEKLGFELALEGDDYILETITVDKDGISTDIVYYRKAKTGDTIPDGQPKLSAEQAAQNLANITENGLFEDTVYGVLYRVLATRGDNADVVSINFDETDSTIVGKYVVRQDSRLVGEIDVLKDMVVRGQQIVNVVSAEDYTVLSQESGAVVDDDQTTLNGKIYEAAVANTTIADKKYIKLTVANGNPVYIDIDDLGEAIVPIGTFDNNQGKIKLEFIEESGVRYLVASLLPNSIGTTELANGSITEAKLEASLLALINQGVQNYEDIGAWSDTVGTALTTAQVETLETEIETLTAELEGASQEREDEINERLDEINTQLSGVRYDLIKEARKHKDVTEEDPVSGEEVTRKMTVEEEVQEAIDNLPLATHSANGLMSKEDKGILDNISYSLDEETGVITITAPDGNGNMTTFTSTGNATDEDFDELFGDGGQTSDPDSP